MEGTSDAWLALIGAIMGGTGLKFLDAWISRSKHRDDTATKFRDELRGEVDALRAETRLQKEYGEEWRTKYYRCIEDGYTTKAEHIEAVVRITALEAEVELWRSRYYQLWEDMAIERDARTKKPVPSPESLKEVDGV